MVRYSIEAGLLGPGRTIRGAGRAGPAAAAANGAAAKEAFRHRSNAIANIPAILTAAGTE